jgi:DNA-binding PadR family transcriptional regulator
MSRLSSPLTTEHALLGFLRQQPMHGYEIYQRLSDPNGLGPVWRLKQSQLYALLAKLEEESYLTVTVELQDTRPPRKIFQLTEAGRAAFLAWVESPVPHGRTLRLDFLAKLYFAQREGPEIALHLIEAQRALCRSWLTAQQQEAHALSGARPYEWLVHQFRIGQIEAMLAWLDTCQEVLSVPVD